MDIFVDNFWHYPILVLVGCIVGVINTMAGGGSLITLPILIFLGLPSNIANGTNRIGLIMTAFSANMGFKSKGVSTYPFNVYIGLFALIGSLIGAYIAVDINDKIFNRTLSVIMIIVIILILFSPKILKRDLNERLSGKNLVVSCFVFFFIGIYGGFVNAGIGFIIMLFLNLYNKMNLVRVNATKSVVILIYSIGAFLTFLFNDLVNFGYGFALGFGTLFGAWWSSRYSVIRGEGIIKIFLLISIFLLSVKLWFV
ncbi:MAG: sulfite exporter TauE/SafE family protein [Cryomorphaceae bacterium]|nr:MAG: sulfite exporter TauE/SafE family protein [Cryomorphaceae bacterium]